MDDLTAEDHNALCVAASDAYQSTSQPAERWRAVVEAVLSLRDDQVTRDLMVAHAEAGDYPDAKAPPADGRTGVVTVRSGRGIPKGDE